jgi:Short C-terminal domain
MPISSDPTAGFASVFPIIFGVFLVIIVVIAGVTLVAGAMKTKRVVESGHNPLTLDTDLALKVLDSQALAPTDRRSVEQRPVEQRLAELDALHAKGAISEDEHAKARERILGSL